jgi:hypothetical protein
MKKYSGEDSIEKEAEIVDSGCGKPNPSYSQTNAEVIWPYSARTGTARSVTHNISHILRTASLTRVKGAKVLL